MNVERPIILQSARRLYRHLRELNSALFISDSLLIKWRVHNMFRNQDADGLTRNFSAMLPGTSDAPRMKMVQLTEPDSRNDGTDSTQYAALTLISNLTNTYLTPAHSSKVLDIKGQKYSSLSPYSLNLCALQHPLDAQFFYYTCEPAC